MKPFLFALYRYLRNVNISCISLELCKQCLRNSEDPTQRLMPMIALGNRNLFADDKKKEKLIRPATKPVPELC